MILTEAIHVLSPIPAPDSIEGKKLIELRELLEQDDDVAASLEKDRLTDRQLVRFLIARNYNVDKAYDLFLVAFTWRQLRKPNELEKVDGWGNRMGHEAETGNC